MNGYNVDLYISLWPLYCVHCFQEILFVFVIINKKLIILYPSFSDLFFYIHAFLIYLCFLKKKRKEEEGIIRECNLLNIPLSMLF